MNTSLNQGEGQFFDASRPRHELANESTKTESIPEEEDEEEEEKEDQQSHP